MAQNFDFLTADLTSTVAAIRDGRTTSQDVVAACLDRTAKLDGCLLAFSEVLEREALATARARDLEREAGTPLSPLHGAPVVVKDLLDIEGRVTAAGSATRSNRVAGGTATTVRRLMQAGAVVIGKTNLVEFAFGGWGTNQGTGTPWNPWDARVHRSPGGSSSGSAVAVAVGLAAGALGTDTGGSVRIPAAFCGLTGLRVSEGRVSAAGMQFVSRTLDTVGPMAWSAADVALLLDAIHGPDASDPRTFRAMPERFTAVLTHGVAGMRIGVPSESSLGVVEGAVMDAVAAALREFTALGCVLVELERDPDFEGRQRLTSVIIAAEAYAENGKDASNPTPGDPAARARVLSGRDITTSAYLDALTGREEDRRTVPGMFETVDVLAFPTLPITAKPLVDIDEGDLSPSRFTRFASHYGLCAMAVPCGFDDSGLPVSIQLVAAPSHEARLLRLAHAYQQATDWHRRRPDIG